MLLLTSGFFLVLGWMQKAHCLRTKVGSDGTQLDLSGRRQFVSACYSDTIPLFGSRGLDHLAFPYVYSWTENGRVRWMEYPVLTGLWQWLMAAIARPVGWVWNILPLPQAAPAAVYFGVSAFFLSLCWMTAVALVAKMAGHRVWDTVLMAASPLVIVHAFTNFDLASILAAVAALSLWAARRPAWAGVAAGLGISLKLWPVFLVGAIGLMCLRTRAFRAMWTFTAGVVGACLVVNIPIALIAPRGWAEFFLMNSDRGFEGSTIYAVISHMADGSSWINRELLASSSNGGLINKLSLLLLVALLVGLTYVVFTVPTTPRVAQVVFLATTAFLITNKVWSPQYSIWLLPLIVLAVPRFRLVMTYAAIEMVYWYLRMWQFIPAKQAAPNWLVDPVTVVRIVLLLVMCTIVVREMHAGTDPVRRAHGGTDPLAGVFADVPARPGIRVTWKKPQAGAPAPVAAAAAGSATGTTAAGTATATSATGITATGPSAARPEASPSLEPSGSTDPAGGGAVPSSTPSSAHSSAQDAWGEEDGQGTLGGGRAAGRSGTEGAQQC